MDRFEAAIDGELEAARAGSGILKAVRGEYGSGKTFFARWLQERAKRAGFAVAEVQISETETPLHRLETVYRRLMERLSSADQEQGAFRSIVDAWFFAREEDVMAGAGDRVPDSGRTPGENQRTDGETPGCDYPDRTGIQCNSSGLSCGDGGWRQRGDNATAEALLAWVSGQPNVAAAAKRAAGIKGDVDHYGALCFLQGLLVMLRDGGFSGLVVVLDEVETPQRVRGDVREKALNALRR